MKRLEMLKYRAKEAHINLGITAALIAACKNWDELDSYYYSVLGSGNGKNYYGADELRESDWFQDEIWEIRDTIYSMILDFPVEKSAMDCLYFLWNGYWERKC